MPVSEIPITGGLCRSALGIATVGVHSYAAWASLWAGRVVSAAGAAQLKNHTWPGWRLARQSASAIDFTRLMFSSASYTRKKNRSATMWTTRSQPLAAAMSVAQACALATSVPLTSSTGNQASGLIPWNKETLVFITPPWALGCVDSQRNSIA